MSSNKFCPVHNKELKFFEGTSKKTGKPYSMHKCTARVGEGWCDYVLWPDNVNGGTTPKFDKHGEKTEAKWPPEIVEILKRIDENVQFIKDRTQS